MTTIGKTRQPLARAPRGVLHTLAAGDFEHVRMAAPPALEHAIEHFWRVRWNLEGRPPQVQETLPHPNANLVVEPGVAAAYGVFSARWTKVLEGRSQAFGIKFRPGAFRALLGAPMSTIADRSVRCIDLFGEAGRELDATLALDDAGACALAGRFIAERLPAPDPQALLAAAIVDSVVDDRELHTVAQLAERHGMGVRALQRLFGEYVGASPKWVLDRYRMHEAIARVQAGQAVSWAALAQDLGYFDQAHFIAAFRKLVGRTPAEYARGHLS
jgi:AraC-like DNA-binding protein